ncbi:alpha/beta fold hydrolase [Micromonospora zhanjiangensis]|uniref:Alpha/beta fold hydrolase n=1 Tax=Micromonospora zhanjiangensis TaxID=1522057 RepID=A0ABV8KK75_9ACTN
MTASYFDRGTGRIAYDVQGDGPLVLCVPGMGVLRSAFRFTVPALVEAGHRVATMDLRGHGDSDADFDAYDDPALATDILALIDHLGGPALVLGHSMGSAGAVIAAADRPDRIAGLALLGPFVRDPKSNPAMALAQRLLLTRPWGPAAWVWFYGTLNAGRKPADFAADTGRIRQSLRRADHWRSFVRTTRTSHAPAEGRLAAVRAPALVLMGEQDPDFPDPTAEGRWIADRLRGELLPVPEAGHYPMSQRPDLVNPALVQFAGRIFTRA